MNLDKEFTIYSKWLAAALRNQGFRLIRTGINENFPQYNTYIFENNLDLQIAIRYLTEKRKKRQR